MKILLIVIAVSNGRFYNEEPQYAMQFATEQQCQVAAAKYPVGGINYQRAVCVPLVQNTK